VNSKGEVVDEPDELKRQPPVVVIKRQKLSLPRENNSRASSVKRLILAKLI
jgi:hypothetical protein